MNMIRASFARHLVAAEEDSSLHHNEFHKAMCGIMSVYTNIIEADIGDIACLAAMLDPFNAVIRMIQN